MRDSGWNWILALFLWAAFAASLSAQVEPEVRARFESARRLMGEERYPEAWEALQQLVTDELELTPAYRSFVEVSSLLEDLEAAASYFEGRLAADPTDAYAHYGRGLAATEIGELDKAIVSHQRALELQPRLMEALDDRGGLTRAYQRVL